MSANSTAQPLTNQGAPANGTRRGLVEWAQFAATIATALGLFVAAWTATQGQVTVDRDTRVTVQQTEDAQLSTAISAIGSGDTAEEVAGLVLLSRNTDNRFTLMSESKELPGDVFDDYTTTLQILSGYLSSHSQSYLAGTSPQISATFGRGYGVPPSPGLPIDLTYAADQVEFLLSMGMQSSVAALHSSTSPAIDLSEDELLGQPWTGVNFAWVFADMSRADLRGANLERSQWSARSTLAGTDLQCADLKDADFRGANLSGADLSGADVTGADFRGANLKGAALTPVYGTAQWSAGSGAVAVSAHGWNQGTCLRDRSFWRS